MYRLIVAVLGVLILAGLVIFLLLPLEPPTPAASSVTSVTQGQEDFARHLELGLIYERNGVLDKAQAEYGQAALSKQIELVAAAQAGLERVLARQETTWLKLQTATGASLFWIARNVVLLAIIIVVAWLIWVIVAGLPRRPGYLFLPFADYTGGELGKGLHALVNLRLQEAKDIHQRQRSGLLQSSERLEVPLFGTLSDGQDGLTNSLAALDSFSIGGIELPLGKVLLATRQWASTREHVITGSLHRHGEALRLCADVRNTMTGAVVYSWELLATAGAEPASSVAALADELAFRILFDICPQPDASTWRSLQLFTLGMQESDRYGVESVNNRAAKAGGLRLVPTAYDPRHT